MFGEQTAPFDIDLNGAQLSFSQGGDGFYHYRRVLNGETVSKTLTDSSGLSVFPVEPVHLPAVHPGLLVQFRQPVHVLAHATQVVYGSFPLEIGVMLNNGTGSSQRLLDVFTQARQKLTLHGNPATGMICRFWETDACLEPPEAEKFHTGVLRVTIQNTTDHWSEINRMVIRAIGMKLFHHHDLVALSVRMKITSKNTAETGGEDKALHDRMQRAPEMFPTHILNPTGKHFVMEGGW